MKKIRIKPGLKWKGHMFVFQRPDGRFQVQFDAEVADPKVKELFVFDHTIMSAKQLEEWTGLRLKNESDG
jgi:hypothetical protein